MNTKKFNQFVCECCGTTEPRYEEEVMVTVIAINGVELKKVCHDCADKIRKDNPRYLFQIARDLDPEIQEWMNSQEKLLLEKVEQEKNEFLNEYKNCKLVKNVIGTRYYEGFVDVTDPCYGYDRVLGKRLPVATGEYTCVEWDMNYTFTFDGKFYEADDIDVFGIYLNGKIPAHDKMINVGYVGADSGLLGIFDVKKDLDLARWLDDKNQANNLTTHGITIQDAGLVASLGDISMSVYVSIENGEIVAVELRQFDYLPREQ